MPIRQDARNWLVQHNVPGHIVFFASKLYEPPESWTGRHAWWFQVPVNRIEAVDAADIHLMCRTAQPGHEFHHLIVPAQHFRDHMQGLAVLENDKVNLFLSAEDENRFVDERGKGAVQFGMYFQEHINGYERPNQAL